MNPYQAFPQVITLSSAGERRSPADGVGLWPSILIFRLFSAAETLVCGLLRAERGR